MKKIAAVVATQCERSQTPPEQTAVACLRSPFSVAQILRRFFQASRYIYSAQMFLKNWFSFPYPSSSSFTFVFTSSLAEEPGGIRALLSAWAGPNARHPNMESMPLTGESRGDDLERSLTIGCPGSFGTGLTTLRDSSDEGKEDVLSVEVCADACSLEERMSKLDTSLSRPRHTHAKRLKTQSSTAAMVRKQRSDAGEDEVACNEASNEVHSSDCTSPPAPHQDTQFREGSVNNEIRGQENIPFRRTGRITEQLQNHRTYEEPEVNILCQGASFPVHTLVLTEASRYFENICKTEHPIFGTTHLCDDVALHRIDAGVVGRMILFSYIGDYPFPGYEGCTSPSEVLPQMGDVYGEEDEDENLLTLHANMFAAAHRFGIPELVKLSEMRYKNVLISGSLNTEDFAASVGIIYNATSASKGLRKYAPIGKPHRLFDFRNMKLRWAEETQKINVDVSTAARLQQEPDLKSVVVWFAQKYISVLRDSSAFLDVMQTDCEFMRDFARGHCLVDAILCQG